MTWCTAYNNKSDRMVVFYPESEITEKAHFDIFPINDKFKSFLTSKYDIRDGDIISFPFITKDYPPECFDKT